MICTRSPRLVVMVFPSAIIASKGRKSTRRLSFGKGINLREIFGTSRVAPATIDPSAPTPARSEPIVLGVIRSSVTSTDIGLAFGFNDAVGLAHEFLTREQQLVDMRSDEHTSELQSLIRIS